MTHTSDITHSVKEACAFLSAYASWLLGCGATCARIEKNTRRIAEAMNVDVVMTITAMHVSITVWNASHTDTCTDIVRTPHTGISFDINTELSKLSWAVADNRVSIGEAMRRFDAIKNTAPTNQWQVLILTSLANASFCRLFGGDWVSMLIVLIATAMGYRVKQMLLGERCDVRIVFFCSALVSSIIAGGAHLFHWGNTPDIAVATSVLYLIPGVPYLNSVSDLLDGHYVCSLGRFMNAIVLTVCLSLGLCGGLMLMQLEWF